MRIAFLLSLALLVSPAGAQTLIDTQFAQSLSPVKDKTGQITGKLPKGWGDNSSWAKVWIDYSPAEQQGRSFLAARITKAIDGRMQLMHNLGTLEAEGYFRLSIIARSTSHTPVDLGIRQHAAPYQFLWQTTVELGDGWTSKTLEFHLAKHDKPVAFFIMAGGVGEIDLASLKLERRTREQLMEDLKKRHPGPAPVNLLRQTTFPLGLPCGWALDREFNDGPDEVLIGPGKPGEGKLPGTTALAVRARENFAIWSAPFEAPRAFEKHTLSFYVRGNGEGRAIVLAGAKWLANRPFKSASDTQWTRINLTFSPAILAASHVLRIEGKGALEFDAFQVNAGAQPGEFATVLPCEAHISLQSPARVWFSDEPAKLLTAVTGKVPPGAKLRIKATNVYGQETLLPPSAASPAATIDCSSVIGPVLGPWRFEAWAEDGAGKPVSSIGETVAYRLVRPRYWGKDAPDSPFGTHTLSANRHLLMAKSAGVNWTRLHDAGTVYAGWRYLEKEKGQWTFNDAPLQRYRQHHIKILGALATSPNWATNFEQPHNSYFDQFYIPKNFEDYANYVRVVTARYRNVIDTWDVWNEPWNHEWWGIRYDEEKGKKDSRLGYVTPENPTAEFARLVDVAVKSTKSTSPALKVAGINSYAGPVGDRWTRGMVAAGGEKLPDIYCYHHYTSEPNLFPGDSVERGKSQAVGAIAEKLGRIDKPVWMTEGSAMRHRIGSGVYLHTYPAGAGEDFWATGDNLCRYVISLRANGVAKIFLYSMHGHNYLGNGGEWRVLVTDEGYLHPSAAAHSHMAWLLEDTTFAKRLDLAPNLWAYVFTGQGRSVAVIAPRPGTTANWPALSNPRLTVTDLFGNAVKDRAKVGPSICYATLEGDVPGIEKTLAAK